MPSWRWIARISLRRAIADLGVEGREGLVEQEDLRLDRQRAGQRHALLLAARELARVAVAASARWMIAQHLVDALVDLVAGRLRIFSPKPTLAATVMFGKSA